MGGRGRRECVRRYFLGLISACCPAQIDIFFCLFRPPSLYTHTKKHPEPRCTGKDVPQFGVVLSGLAGIHPTLSSTQKLPSPLHEPLALAIPQDPPLPAAALGDEAAGAVDTGRVKLDELGICASPKVERFRCFVSDDDDNNNNNNNNKSTFCHRQKWTNSWSRCSILSLCSFQPTPPTAGTSLSFSVSKKD